jgi:hypothetical protein
MNRPEMRQVSIRNLCKVDSAQELACNNQATHHECMNSTKDVTIYYERAWHSGCEDDSVRVTRRQDHASVKICLYRKAMGLRHVLITHHESNNISYVSMNHGPWIQRRPMTDTVVEPREIRDYENESWRSHAGRRGDTYNRQIINRTMGRRKGNDSCYKADD